MLRAAILALLLMLALAASGAFTFNDEGPDQLPVALGSPIGVANSFSPTNQE